MFVWPDVISNPTIHQTHKQTTRETLLLLSPLLLDVLKQQDEAPKPGRALSPERREGAKRRKEPGRQTSLLLLSQAFNDRSSSGNGGRDVSPFSSEELPRTDHLREGGSSSLWRAGANPPQRAEVMKENGHDGRSGKHILSTLSTTICYFFPLLLRPGPVASPSLPLSVPLSPPSPTLSPFQQTHHLPLISRERRNRSSRNTN